MIQRSKSASSSKTPKVALTSDVARRAPAVIALMEMGLSDYTEIGTAVGLSAKEVKLIDMADDGKIRSLATAGTPPGTYVPLAKPVRCPHCNGMVTMAPCVACDKRWDETALGG